MAEYPINLLSVHKDATNPPGTAWLNGTPYLTFNDTTDQLFKVSLRMPTGTTGTIKVFFKYSMASATTNNVAIRMQVTAVTDAENITTATADTLEASSDSAVPGTAGLTKEIEHTITNDDSVAAGDYVSIQIGRENATSGTNATGNMRLHALSIDLS